MESVSPIRVKSEGGAPWWVAYVLPFASAIAGIWLGARYTRSNTDRVIEASRQTTVASIWQKANETELKDVQAKLDGFYIPFILLSEANHLLAKDIKSRQPGDFRLIRNLFDRAWYDALPAGDRKLVELICDNAEELRTLIVTKAGLVDGAVLEYLTRAAVHFRILDRAHKKELGDDPETFAKYA